MRTTWERDCRIAAVLVHNLRTGQTKGATTAARVLDLHPAYVGSIAQRMHRNWLRAWRHGAPGWQTWLTLPQTASRGGGRRRLLRDDEFAYDPEGNYRWGDYAKPFDDWWNDRWDGRPVTQRDRFWTR